MFSPSVIFYKKQLFYYFNYNYKLYIYVNKPVLGLS